MPRSATLRCDKVTYAHALELKDAHDFTLADEYLPAAVAAVRLLEEHPVLAADRVFLLGHSGPSSPEEYEPAQHVDATVVADIADWLAAIPG